MANGNGRALWQWVATTFGGLLIGGGATLWLMGADTRTLVYRVSRIEAALDRNEVVVQTIPSLAALAATNRERVANHDDRLNKLERALDRIDAKLTYLVERKP